MAALQAQLRPDKPVQAVADKAVLLTKAAVDRVDRVDQVLLF